MRSTKFAPLDARADGFAARDVAFGTVIGGVIVDNAILYQSDFTSTDLTGWRTDAGGTLTHHSNQHYTDSEYEGFLGTGDDGSGALAFNAGAGSIDTLWRSVDCDAGDVIEAYWVVAIDGDFDGGSYTTAGLTKRIVIQFYDNGDNKIGTTYTDTNPNDAGIVTQTAPANAVRCEVGLQRRSSGSTAPLVIYYLQIRNANAGTSPLAANPKRMEDPWPVLAFVEKIIERNFAGSFDGPVDSVTVDGPASLGLSVEGTVVRFSPTANTPASLVQVTGNRGAVEGIGPVTFYAQAETPDPMALTTIYDIYLEAGQFQVVEPLTYITGGCWPYSVNVTQKPSWLTDRKSKGVLSGVGEGSDGQDTSIIATITDAVGNTIVVTIPVHIFSVDRSSPISITTSGGTLQAQISPSSASTGPEVYQLSAGEHVLGTFFAINRDAKQPLVIMGPDAGTAYFTLGAGDNELTFNQCSGIWVEGNIEVRRTGIIFNDDLGDYTEADLRFTSATDPKSHNRVAGITCTGLRTDLFNEADDWTVREDGGQLIYSEDASTGTVPTSGPEATVCYRGGIQIYDRTMVQDVVVRQTAIAVDAAGEQCGFKNVSLSEVTVDCVRVSGGDGKVVSGVKLGHDDSITRTNTQGNRHSDHVQAVNPNQGPCGRRVVIEDCFFFSDFVGVQAFQFNMGSGGSYDDEGDPRNYAYDWVLVDCLITSSLSNGFNGQGFQGVISNCAILGDKDATDGTTAIIRRDGATKVILEDNILTTLSADAAASPWTISGNVILTGDSATGEALTDVFPNILTSPTYKDPREAVANSVNPNTALFWRNDAQTTKGPTWLSPAYTPPPAPVGPTFADAITDDTENSDDMRYDRDTVTRDGYVWMTGAVVQSIDSRSAFTPNMLAATRAALLAAGSRVVVCDVRAAELNEDETNTDNAAQTTMQTIGGTGTFTLQPFFNVALQDWVVTPTGWDDYGFADVSSLYGLPSGTVFRNWFEKAISGDNTALISKGNGGSRDVDIRSFCIFDRTTFSADAATMATEIAAMAP